MKWRSLLLILLLAGSASARADGPIEVEPADIARRKDLIGKEIIVDDRVNFFFPTPGKGYNKILLKRTDAVLLLPPQFALASGGIGARAVRARGVLRSDETGLFVDVTAKPELFSDDVKRLKKNVELLAAEDAESREAWGDWASRRAAAFNDATLGEMAETLHSEAIALEFRKPANRSPDAILALGKKAREKGVPEPEPSALAHLAFRIRMASAKTAAEFDRIADQVAAFLPNARQTTNADPKLKLDAYLKDPAGEYRAREPQARAALDRRLWSDAVAESFRLRAIANPSGMEQLSREAKSRLPDRPEIGGELYSRAFEAVNVVDLRESEMLERVKNLRDHLKQPEKAEAENRAWLDSRRARLSPTNAEDRAIYAEKYLSQLKDRSTATELLREALKIDPDCPPAISLFQKMGFVKVAGLWQDPNDPNARSSAGDDGRPAPKDDALIGLTPSEVKAQLGEPKRISRVATQGRISIQWVYEGARGAQVIDFLHRAGDPQPSVVGHYSARR